MNEQVVENILQVFAVTFKVIIFILKVIAYFKHY